MAVRDVYIFEGLGRGSSDYDRDGYDRGDYDRDDAEEEILDDARYARRIRRSPPISDRSIRRAARGRRAGAIAEREIVARDIEDREIDDEVDDVPVEAALNRAAFGGMGNLGALLAVIGLLILVAAASGPSWGWGGGGRGIDGPDAYGFGPSPRAGYTDDLSYRYRDGQEGRYAGSAYDGGSRSFMDPSRAMFVGGTLFLVGVVLLATRRRSFLLR